MVAAGRRPRAHHSPAAAAVPVAPVARPVIVAQPPLGSSARTSASGASALRQGSTRPAEGSRGAGPPALPEPLPAAAVPHCRLYSHRRRRFRQYRTDRIRFAESTRCDTDPGLLRRAPLRHLTNAETSAQSEPLTLHLCWGASKCVPPHRTCSTHAIASMDCIALWSPPIPPRIPHREFPTRKYRAMCPCRRVSVTGNHRQPPVAAHEQSMATLPHAGRPPAESGFWARCSQRCSLGCDQAIVKIAPRPARPLLLDLV